MTQSSPSELPRTFANKQGYPYSVLYKSVSDTMASIVFYGEQNRVVIMLLFRHLFCASIRLSVCDVACAEKERITGDLSGDLLRGKQLLRCAAIAVRQ